MVKGFTHTHTHRERERIDYNETFSPISCKDSFIIIMALVAHYDLELHGYEDDILEWGSV